jgi:ABC-type ATPase with predicted acetyltransferase domain
MKDKDKDKELKDALRPEYSFDYSKAVRGKYYSRLIAEGANVVVLDPDIAEAFHDSVSVNRALRSLLDLTRSTQRLTRRSRGSSKHPDH